MYVRFADLEVWDGDFGTELRSLSESDGDVCTDLSVELLTTDTTESSGLGLLEEVEFLEAGELFFTGELLIVLYGEGG